MAAISSPADLLRKLVALRDGDCLGTHKKPLDITEQMLREVMTNTTMPYRDQVLSIFRTSIGSPTVSSADRLVTALATAKKSATAEGQMQYEKLQQSCKPVPVQKIKSGRSRRRGDSDDDSDNDSEDDDNNSGSSSDSDSDSDSDSGDEEQPPLPAASPPRAAVPAPVVVPAPAPPAVVVPAPAPVGVAPVPLQPIDGLPLPNDIVAALLAFREDAAAPASVTFTVSCSPRIGAPPKNGSARHAFSTACGNNKREGGKKTHLIAAALGLPLDAPTKEKSEVKTKRLGPVTLSYDADVLRLKVHGQNIVLLRKGADGKMAGFPDPVLVTVLRDQLLATVAAISTALFGINYTPEFTMAATDDVVSAEYPEVQRVFAALFTTGTLATAERPPTINAATSMVCHAYAFWAIAMDWCTAVLYATCSFARKKTAAEELGDDPTAEETAAAAAAREVRRHTAREFPAVYIAGRSTTAKLLSKFCKAAPAASRRQSKSKKAKVVVADAIPVAAGGGDGGGGGGGGSSGGVMVAAPQPLLPPPGGVVISGGDLVQMFHMIMTAQNNMNGREERSMKTFAGLVTDMKEFMRMSLEAGRRDSSQ